MRFPRWKTSKVPFRLKLSECAETGLAAFISPAKSQVVALPSKWFCPDFISPVRAAGVCSSAVRSEYCDVLTWRRAGLPMSKLKSPQENKAVSLKTDRRNTYGENPQASRKGIRRGKQRSHMGERREL